MMHQYILCIFPDSSCRPIRINDDYTFNLSIFLEKWRNESHSLFYVSPSLIQILPENGLISLPEIFTQDVISYHLQFLPKTFPQYILRIYPICFAIEDGNNRNSSNINDNNINIDEINQGKNCLVADNPYFELNLWNIGFNFNSEFTLKLLQEIFSTSFCVDYESLSFHVESSKDNISMDLPIFSQRNILKTSKLYMYVKMQIASMKCAKQREKNIKEIKVTELNYVNELELVSKLFNEAFFEGLNISKDIYCRTFKSISDIKPIHEEFLKSLNEAGNTVESSIGQTFLKFNPMFKISLPHICNFAAANEEINELLTTNKNFSMETSKILKNYFDGKPLNSILVTPIQRLPRYPLLLRDLLKVTSKNHWDYSNIKHAYGEIQLIVKTMDDKKQESDQQNIVVELQSKLGNNYSIMKSGRRCIMSLDNIRIKESFKGSVFLFNDTIFVMKSFPVKYYEESLIYSTVEKRNKSIVINLKNDQGGSVHGFTISENVLNSEKFCQEFQMARRDLIKKMSSYGNAIIWSKIKYNFGPQSIDSPSLLYIDNSLYLFGGRYPDGQCSNDIWVRDTGKWILLDTLNAPSPRFDSIIVEYDLDKFIIYGGQDQDNIFNDLYVFNVSTRSWTYIDSFNKPTPRYGQTGSIINNQLLIFGGRSQNGDFSNEINIYTFIDNQWTTWDSKNCLGILPNPRAWSQSFILTDSITNKTAFAIHGGAEMINGEDIISFDDVWTFYIHSKEWKQLSVIPNNSKKRYGHVGAVINNEFYVIGGKNEKGVPQMPQKLSFKDTQYSWKNIPQCDEPDYFIFGVIAVIPEYGLALYNSKNDLLKIKITHRSNDKINIKKRPKTRRRLTGTCTWSKPFYNAKLKQVSMKIDEDDIMDFSFGFNTHSLKSISKVINETIFWRKTTVLEMDGTSSLTFSSNDHVLGEEVFNEEINLKHEVMAEDFGIFYDPIEILEDENEFHTPKMIRKNSNEEKMLDIDLVIPNTEPPKKRKFLSIKKSRRSKGTEKCRLSENAKFDNKIFSNKILNMQFRNLKTNKSSTPISNFSLNNQSPAEEELINNYEMEIDEKLRNSTNKLFTEKDLHISLVSSPRKPRKGKIKESLSLPPHKAFDLIDFDVNE